MKRAVIAGLLLLLAGGAGAGTYYGLVYREGGLLSDGIPNSTGTSTDTADVVYVNPVSMLAGLGSGNGIINRYAGVIEPQQTWDAKLESEKTVEETYVKEGDTVKTGDKLFKYKTTEDEDKLAQDQIDLERLANDIETAKKRIEQLQKEKSKASADDQLTYTTDILQQENTIKQNEYEIKTKELEISQLEESIKNAVVTCELDGVVKTVKKSTDSTSSFMSGSDTTDAYITIMAVGDYQVKCMVNEQNISDIEIDAPMIVTSRVDSSLHWTGRVTDIKMDAGVSNNADSGYYGFDSGSSDNSTSSTNYPFYIALDSSEDLMLGQHVFVENDLGQNDAKEGIWLDEYYFVTEEDGSAWVWAAGARDRLEKRSVTLGEYDEELMKWEVLEGLGEEDYIASPFDEPEEGAPVSYVDLDDGEEEYADGEWPDEGGEDFAGEEWSDEGGEDFAGGEWSDEGGEDFAEGDYVDDGWSDDGGVMDGEDWADGGEEIDGVVWSDEEGSDDIVYAPEYSDEEQG